MSNINALFSEGWAIVATIDPDTYSGNGGEQLSDAVDMTKYEQIAAICMSGDSILAGRTIACTLKSCATSGGSYAAISGKTSTIGDESPLAKDSQVVLELRGEEVTSNERYVKLSATFASTSSPLGSVDFSAVVLGRARHNPASGGDLSTVTVVN